MSSAARYGWLWFAVGDASSKASTFVVLSQVSRHFVGVQSEAFVLSQTATALLIAGGDLGFRSIGIRHIALANDGGCDAEAIVHIGRAIQRRRAAAAALIGMPVAMAAVVSLSDSWDTRRTLAYLSLCWLPYFLGYDWVLLALGDFRRLTWSRLANVSMILFATACAVYFEYGIWCVGLGYAVGYGAQACVAAGGMPRPSTVVGRPEPHASIAECTSWRSSLTLAVALAASALFHAEEVLMTGWFQGASVAAQFGAGFRLILTGCSLAWLATQYLSPRLATTGGATRARQLSYAAPLCLWGLGAAAVTLALGGPLCQLVYGNAFPGAAATLQKLAPVIALDAVAALLGTVLVMQGRGVASLISTAVGVLGSALTFMCLRTFTHVGGLDLPIAAKYGGYLCLLVAQLNFAVLRASDRHGVSP